MTWIASTLAKAAVGAAVLAGVSCKLGPEYVRPAVPQPRAFPQQEGPAGAASVADQAWWRVFEDPALQALVNQALARNQDLQIATARVEQARGQAFIAGAGLLPSISAVGDIFYGKGSLPAIVPPTGRAIAILDGGLTMSWELDLWGRLRRLREGAIAAYQASVDDQRGVQIMLISDVAQAYFRLRTFDRQLEVSKATVDIRRQTLQLTEERLRGGKASGLDVARAAALVAGAIAAAVQSQQSTVETEHLLAFLLGEGPRPIPRGASVAVLAVPDRIPIGLPSALLDRRPDIRAAESRLRAANAQIGVAVASFLPQVSLTGAFGAATLDLGRMAAMSSTVYSVGAQASLLAPILQGRELRGQLRVSKAQWQELKAGYERSAVNAFREVADALAAHRYQRELRTAREEQVAQLSRATALAEDRYRGGVSDYLDLLSAQQDLFAAQLQLAQAQGEQLIALVQLYRALGGGWTITPDTAPATAAR